MHEKNFLTRSEAAEYLGVAPQTLANNRHTGPAYHKLFGAVRYSVQDLDNWARQQRVTSLSSLSSNVLQLRSPSKRQAV